MVSTNTKSQNVINKGKNSQINSNVFSKRDPLTDLEVSVTLITKYKQTGDQETLYELFMLSPFQSSVKYLSNKYSSKINSFDDMCQESFFVFKELVDSYNVKKNTNPIIYVRKYLEQRMIDHLRMQDSSFFNRSRVKMRQMLFELGVDDTYKNAMNYLLFQDIGTCKTTGRFLPNTIKNAYLKEVSLNRTIGEEGATELIDFILDESGIDADIIIDKIQDNASLSIIFILLNKLSFRNKYILDHYYGLNGCEIMTNKQIGNVWGISDSRVSQLHTQIRNNLVNDYATEFNGSYLGDKIDLDLDNQIISEDNGNNSVIHNSNKFSVSLNDELIFDTNYQKDNLDRDKINYQIINTYNSVIDYSRNNGCECQIYQLIKNPEINELVLFTCYDALLHQRTTKVNLNNLVELIIFKINQYEIKRSTFEEFIDLDYDIESYLDPFDHGRKIEENLINAKFKQICGMFGTKGKVVHSRVIERKTFQEIGDELGVSRQRVQQIESEIKPKIFNLLKN